MLLRGEKLALKSERSTCGSRCAAPRGRPVEGKRPDTDSVQLAKMLKFACCLGADVRRRIWATPII